MSENKNSWPNVELGKIAGLITKGTTPTTLGHQYQPEGIPFIKVENISNSGIKTSTVHQYISIEAHQDLKRSQFRENDVLFSVAGTIGKTALVTSKDIPANTNQAVAIIRDYNRALTPHFLRYQLKFLASTIKESNERGGAMKNISLGDLRSSKVTIPPLAEQKVIADKLDTLLAQVESTKSRLERIPTILKRFRQSVLSSAVSGKLTKDWRKENDYTELTLLLPKSNKVIMVPSSWANGTLKSSCKIISGNAFKSGDFIDVNDVPVIKISNVQYGEFEIKNQQYLPNEFLEKHENFRVFEGDLLMALTRPITNDTLKICRYPNHQKTGLLNQRVAKFVFRNEKEKAFFEFLFQSDYFKSQVVENLSETLQPNLSPRSLQSFNVSIPPIPEQQEIVQRVEKLFSYADRIESQANAALDRVNNLTQSILAKAFRGELTADWRTANPDLISGENSAESLLARIQSERAVQQSVKKKRRKP